MRFAAACRRCADWLPVRIVLRGANAATRAHVARVCACDKTRRDEKRRRSRRLVFLLPRPRRELASVLAPTTRRAPPREMAPPRSRRRDQPRASGERRSAATMRRDVPAEALFFREGTHSVLVANRRCLTCLPPCLCYHMDRMSLQTRPQPRRKGLPCWLTISLSRSYCICLPPPSSHFTPQ